MNSKNKKTCTYLKRRNIEKYTSNDGPIVTHQFIAPTERNFVFTSLSYGHLIRT